MNIAYNMQCMKRVLFIPMFLVIFLAFGFGVVQFVKTSVFTASDPWEQLFGELPPNSIIHPEKNYPTLSFHDKQGKIITATLIPSVFSGSEGACYGLLNTFPETYYGVSAADRVLSSQGVIAAGAMRYWIRYRDLTPSGFRSLVFVEVSYGCLILEEDGDGEVAIQTADRVRP